MGGWYGNLRMIPGVEIAHPEGRRTIQFLGEPSPCNSRLLVQGKLG